jgi:hypothetical protein
MSDERGLPQTAEEVQEFMDRLSFEEPPTAQVGADTLASLPAGSEVMVVRSVQLPLEVDQAVTDAALAAEVPKSTWIRQAIEAAAAMQADQDEPISCADALRVLTLLRAISPVA